jgi:uncharacterized protein (TIGR03083 family)
VPNCPEWTVEQLVRHVATVYLHKVECIRQQKWPQPWPPPELASEPALDLLDRSYAELTGEFAAHQPPDPATTWYDPEQTVGFWIRRMAQETVIHRVDAEQALGEPLAEIPDDLALDGVDEILERFLGFMSQEWPEDFAPDLPPAEAPGVLVSTGGHGWLLRATPGGVLVESAASGGDAPARLGGEPVAVLLWLWRRAESGVTREGDLTLIEQIHTLLRKPTE